MHPYIARETMYWSHHKATEPSEIRQQPERGTLQQFPRQELFRIETFFDTARNFLQRSSSLFQKTPTFFHFLDLPQELIDIILDTAIINELSGNSISIKVTSKYAQHSKKSSSALDPFMDFPFILPDIPKVFHINHAIRAGLLRRHACNILKLVVPGCNDSMGPWIYHPPYMRRLRFTSPAQLSRFHIALFMRCISPQLVVTRALRISTMWRSRLIRPTFEHLWRVEMKFQDKDNVERAIGVRTSTEDSHTSGEINWKYSFCPEQHRLFSWQLVD